jgi:hypothetical protein
VENLLLPVENSPFLEVHLRWRLTFIAGYRLSSIGQDYNRGDGYQSMQDTLENMKPLTSNPLVAKLFTITALLLAGCSQTTSTNPSNTPSPTASSPPATSSPTQTPIPAVPNTVPTDPLSATPTPAPAPSEPSATGAIDDQKPIQFQPGATTATVEGKLPAKRIDRYTFAATAGQSTTVSINSPGQDVLLTIVDPQGSPMQRYQSGSPTWSGKLPTDGIYMVDVVATGKASSYTLTVSIQPQ